jgi:hypothetical protein
LALAAHRIVYNYFSYFLVYFGYFSIGFCGEVVISSDAFPWLPMHSVRMSLQILAGCLGLAVDVVISSSASDGTLYNECS